MGKNASNMEEKVKKGTRILGRRERFRNEKLRNQIKKNATETSTTRLDQKDQRRDCDKARKYYIQILKGKQVNK